MPLIRAKTEFLITDFAAPYSFNHFVNHPFKLLMVFLVWIEH